MYVTVVIPTHNPDEGRLQRTLEGLKTQSLPSTQWEIVLVDNASTPPLDAAAFAAVPLGNLRVVREPQLGLTAARRRGFTEALAPVALLVDDDNVLAPDYLATVLDLLAAHPKIGALGGKSVPEFAVAPPDWTEEFHGLLALRDLGDNPLVSTGLRPAGSSHTIYPAFAPIGAGMAIRRAAWQAWLDSTTGTAISDRRGDELTSSGDNDLVLSVMRAGWEVGYFPSLKLTHLIPAARLEPDYLARLNRGIQKSWMQVLSLHEANPWPPLSAASARLRQLKAWFLHQPWRSSAARIRWQGACGHFEGRIKR
jgi:glycosyltransferase involved in cell wall biosynthesis